MNRKLFALRDIESKMFLAGTVRNGFKNELVELDKARLYKRKCDAANSLPSANFHRFYNVQEWHYKKFEIIELKVNLEVVE